MKIQVLQREFESDGYYQKSYKICDCQYCCEKIKSIPNIDFYFEYAENTDNPIGEDGVNLDLGVMLQHDVTTYDPWERYDLGYTQEFFYKLDYCPICGEKIEVEIVDNVDVTKEFELLAKERQEVHRKWMKTDSIKKQTEYLNRRQELDREIDSFYQTDRLPGKVNKYEEY